jgi:hypothetical protein
MAGTCVAKAIRVACAAAKEAKVEKVTFYFNGIYFAVNASSDPRGLHLDYRRQCHGLFEGGVGPVAVSKPEYRVVVTVGDDFEEMAVFNTHEEREGFIQGINRGADLCGGNLKCWTEDEMPSHVSEQSLRKLVVYHLFKDLNVESKEST